MNRLSLNSEGALRTIIQRRTPQAKNNTSTVNRINRKKQGKRNEIWNFKLFSQRRGYRKNFFYHIYETQGVKVCIYLLDVNV